MTVPTYIVDAFTDREFAGNPAAVVVLPQPDPPDDRWLSAVAAEFNLSETAFVTPRREGGWSLRWFTPAIEVELCGHATLAAAHVLFAHAGVTETPIEFHTRWSGVLAVRRLDDGRLEMDFPTRTPTRAKPTDDLLEALGGAPIETWSHSQGYDLVVYRTADEVARLEPDHAALARIGSRGVIITAPGDVAGGQADFVSRYFAPAAGITEDPVTGSAHCVLAPYWSRQLGRNPVVGHQVSKRGGTVECEGAGDRVLLRGAAITIVEGTIRVRP
jgi:PhzF family phenazine biosynthesis protein